MSGHDRLDESCQTPEEAKLCPLWLFVGTPTALGPQLASRLAEHSLPVQQSVFQQSDKL